VLQVHGVTNTQPDDRYPLTHCSLVNEEKKLVDFLKEVKCRPNTRMHAHTQTHTHTHTHTNSTHTLKHTQTRAPHTHFYLGLICYCKPRSTMFNDKLIYLHNPQSESVNPPRAKA
jgi:hypothetical protein